MAQEKKHKKNKKASAMAQVHNRVNSGIMDAVTCGGMCEAAEPEDDKYKLGTEEGGSLSDYGHVNETSDVVGFLDIDLHSSNAYPFITFVKKDGTDTDTFVGEAGEEHNTMSAKLLSNHEIRKEDFNSLWDIKRNEYKSGRIWFLDDTVVASFYSYKRDNYQAMYDDIAKTLSIVREKLDESFNIGKVILDFWTFVRGHEDVLVPVRWLNNGIADAYFPHMIQCLPVENGYFKIVTRDMGKYILDWKGDEVLNENEHKKTVFITEEQLNAMRVLLENEGTNLKKARNLLKSKGYDEQQRQQVLDSIRHDIPNSRLHDCKFILGVVRLYLDGQLGDGMNIMSLNKVLKYVAMDAHVNEYDNNLNGESLESLISKFSGVAADELQNSIQASNARTLNVNKNYKIVPIDTPEEASKYARYFPDEERWCVTEDEDAYNAYTNDGLGRFYFCLRSDFKTTKHVISDGCPLDNYGLSMIAVSVNDDGSVNTITCRWNHSNGGSDHVMDVSKLEDIVGRNFYQTFKPYTKEELRARGLTPFDDIPKLLNDGAKPEDIFKKIQPFGKNAYEVETGGRANFIREVDGKYVLCFGKWFNSVFLGEDETGFEYAMIESENKYNFLLPDFSYLLDEFMDYAEPFVNGYAKVYKGERTKFTINLVGTDGSFIFKEWIDPKTEFSFDEPDAEGNLIVNKYFGEEVDSPDDYDYDKVLYNIISIKKPENFLMGEWCKSITETSWFVWEDKYVNGYSVADTAIDDRGKTCIRNILLPDGTPIFGKDGIPAINIDYHCHVMFIIRYNSVRIFSTLSKKFTPWFDEVSGRCVSSHDLGYIPLRVKLNGKINYLSKMGDYLSDEFFDNGELFLNTDTAPKVVKVIRNDKANFMDKNGNLLSKIWFINTGNEWTTDFYGNDPRRRILVRASNGVWYKLYEDGELTDFDQRGGMLSSDYKTIHGYGNIYSDLFESKDNNIKHTVMDQKTKNIYNKWKWNN